MSSPGLVNLRCEYPLAPLSIDAATPCLSWEPRASRRGWKQSAYRVQVASSAANLTAGRADVWDSGKVASA